MHLLRRIEKHLRGSRMSASQFGREAVRDQRFVFDLRNGREPRAKTVDRVVTYLEASERRSDPCSR